MHLYKRNSLLWRVLVVFILALLARLLFFAWRGASSFPDSSEYLTLAHNLVTHSSFSLEAAAPFVPSIRRAPAYPVFLAALEWLGLLSPGWIVGVQAFCDSLVTVMILWLTRQVAPIGWATAAAVFYALQPGAIYTTTTVLSEPLFTFLLTLSVTLLIYGVKTGRRVVTLGSALVMGAAIVCRPIALLLPFVFLAILLFKRRPQHALLFAVVSILAVLPWTIRTSSVSGELVFVQGSGAVNYWAPTVLFLDQRNEKQIWQYQAELLKQRLPDGPSSPQKMLESDRVLKREAVANVRANPLGYLKSRARAYPYLFLTSFDNFSGLNRSFGSLWSERAIFQLALKSLLLLVFSALPLLLAVIGWLGDRRDLIVSLLGSVWLYMLVVHLPLWIEYRFWVPVVPFLLAMGACGARQLWSMRRVTNQTRFAE